MTDAPLLQVRDLKVTFETAHGRVSAVENVGFELPPGETLVVLGESGSGKSVSSSVVMDLLDCPPGRIEKGEVLLEGKSLLEMPARERRQLNGSRISMIFQDPLSSLNPVFPVGWQIAETLRVHGASDADPKQRALQLLERVGITDPARRYNHYPHQFSGGQRQRIMIAIALALEPDILIADEPTTALDVTIQRQILDLLTSIKRETGMAILLITHDLAVAARMADRVAVMKDGRIVETGTLEELALRPRHPYTRTLLGAIPRLEKPRRSTSERAGGRPLLSVENLHKEYFLPRKGFGKPQKIDALRGISFDLQEGRTLGVVGESGSGKSTLARILMRLAEPSGGSATFEGESIFGLSPAGCKRFHRKVQMVFQDPFGSLNPRMRIEDILTEPLAIHGTILPRQHWHDRAVELIRLVGLPPDALRRYPGQFSGGQCQRIAIARALASEPKLIICDEAVSALDVQVQAQIIELLAELRERLSLSYVFITHDLPVVRSIADEIIVMKNGEIVESGPTEALFCDPKSPYTRELLQASGVPGWMAEAVRALSREETDA